MKNQSGQSYGSIPKITQSENGNDDDINDETTPLTVNIKPNGSSTGTGASKKAIEFSWYDRLVFGWLTPLLHTGNEKQRLDQQDLQVIPFPLDCQTVQVSAAFDRAWNEQLLQQSPSLVKALFAAFGRDFIMAGGLKLVHDLCVFVGPQVLHAMIHYLRTPDTSVWVGIGLTVTVTVSQLTMSLCLRHYFFQLYVTGLRVRTAVVVAVYRKALVLAAAERQTRTLGEITNLTSIDAQRLQDLTSYLHAIWYSPLQIGLALFFLWQQLGASSLGGVAVIVVMIPATKQIAQWMGGMQRTLMRAKDARVELNSEVLAGMKIIKFQAWEEPFAKRIGDLRAQELQALLRYYVGTCFSRLLWTFTPLMVAISTFAAYVWSGHDLDVASALTSLTLFEILRFPLFMLPQIINSVVEATVSLNRVQSFLLCDEYQPVGPGDLDDIGVKMDNVSAAYDSKKPRPDNPDDDPRIRDLADKQWEVQLLRCQLDDAEKRIRELTESSGKRTDDKGVGEEQMMIHEMTQENLLCLKRVNFELKPGELVAVVGGVGCGKSSFINAILGEVHEVSGTTSVKGGLSCFSQSPFIFNATVRDNILFGHVDEEVDEDLYEKSIDVCALREDLANLSDGDQTEIGEKGVTLSGGQKARVALARAVYHNADITLIDDALSAVDAHVAKHLFDKAIVSELMNVRKDTGQKRSVVLVTNALLHLRHPRVDRIVVLKEGRVAEQGTYRELARSNSVFAHFLKVLNESNADNDQSDNEPGSPRRRMSEKQESERKSFATTPTKLMTDETRAIGHVGFGVYKSWISAAGGWIAPVSIVAAFAGTEALSVMANWWLTYWSSHGNEHSQAWFLGIYTIINMISAVAGLGRMLIVVLLGLKASRRLFTDLLASVLHAPQSFYDQTPIGRLINRCSKDVNTIDDQLMNTLRTYLQTLFSVFSTIAVITGVSPIFTLCLIPMIAFYIIEQQFFTVTYRELKRMDSVNRSPIYALLGESVDGVAVIRAFGAQPSLMRRLTNMLDVQQHAYYLTCTAQSWLAVRLEVVGTLIITFACLSAVIEEAIIGTDEAFAGLAGLSISYALSVTQSLNWSVRMASDMEANMVAVERVDEYTRLENEGARETTLDSTLQKWPSIGEIRFENARLRYRPELPLVLKGLDIHIPGGSKVGVVGRTGAGKSTLMIALMRIVDLAEGKIYIDDQDTSQVGLAKLRRNIAVIPQDPVLFSGTIRSNCDPFDEYSDETLYEILERVGLYHDFGMAASGHSNKAITSLEDAVAEGGINFSVGERQLLVIARALLRGARIVIMDEATAAVDAETDAAIQKVMRTEFASATCITVAHRINTIMDSDFILVMDKGRAAEFDSPKTLLEKRGGLFRDLVRASRSN